jgi:hypothetical protein
LKLSQTQKVMLALLAAYLFRLGFGLAMPFWTKDETQTYLIGLKAYTTDTWPYYGPDVNGSETSYTTQIPGALEGLLISVPLRLLPIPEAPYLLLNLLSLFAIALLTWYCSKKVPNLSPGFIFASLVVLPWNLHESTSIINPSWCLFGSVLFYVGFLETVPGFKLGVLRPWLANALMGFAIFWVMQFHMSWMYLAGFLGLSLLLQWREKPSSVLPAVLFAALGALPAFALIVPTLLKYGFPQGHNGSGFASSFNFGNFLQFFTILARYLTLACYEMPRFLGISTKLRIQFLEGSLFTLIPGIFLWIAGYLQAILLLFFWFRKKNELADWPVLRWLVLANLMMVWVSFWFTVKWPLSHIYYINFPLVFLYSLYVYNHFAAKPWWKNLARVYLAAAFVFQIAYAWRDYPQFSIYHDRPRVAKAIQDKDYRIVGDRRPESYY